MFWGRQSGRRSVQVSFFIKLLLSLCNEDIKKQQSHIYYVKKKKTHVNEPSSSLKTCNVAIAKQSTGLDGQQLQDD